MRRRVVSERPHQSGEDVSAVIRGPPVGGKVTQVLRGETAVSGLSRGDAGARAMSARQVVAARKDPASFTDGTADGMPRPWLRSSAITRRAMGLAQGRRCLEGGALASHRSGHGCAAVLRQAHRDGREHG